MKKIYIKHNGCLNLSYDFNIAKSGLAKSGYQFVTDASEADEIVFAGCGVRAAWVDDAIEQINSFTKGKDNQKVIVTGCISKIETTRINNSLNAREVYFKSFQELIDDYTDFSFDQLEKTYSQNESTDLEGDNPLRKKVTPQKENALMFLDQLDRKYGLNLVEEFKKRTSGFYFYNESEPTEMITVSRSCLYNCSFCTIPKGRGDYKSVGLNDILEKVKSALSKGIYRIVLIGDEVGNYGKDLKDEVNFKKLLDKVLELDNKLKIAIRYIEPTPFFKNFDTIKKYCLEDRIYLLHIPLQTGSQELLKVMNRNHNLDKVIPLYKDLIDNTNTTFYCNWMIGFPGESDEDFKKTQDLVRYLNIQLNTVIPFSSRPDTKAEESKNKISSELINFRCEELEKVLLTNKINYFINKACSITKEEQMEMVNLITKASFSNLTQLKG